MPPTPHAKSQSGGVTVARGVVGTLVATPITPLPALALYLAIYSSVGACIVRCASLYWCCLALGGGFELCSRHRSAMVWFL
jgi:hypothetical protein